MSNNTTQPKPFRPSDYMMNLKGKDYLPVAARIAWANAEYPKGFSMEILEFTSTSFTEEDPRNKGKTRVVREAFARVRVSFPNGAVYEDIGSETSTDFGDYKEKAVTKAYGRALAQAGYGTMFAPEFDESATLDRKSGIEGVRIVDTPVKVKPKPEPEKEVKASAAETPATPAPAPQEPPQAPAPETPAQNPEQLSERLRELLTSSDGKPDAVKQQVHTAISTANRAHKVERASLLPLEPLQALVATVEGMLAAAD